MQGPTIYVSATPSNYEIIHSEESVVEQFIRPTGLVDPPLSLHKSTYQIEHLLEEIDDCRRHNERIIVTTITKRMSEELSSYLEKIGIPTRYIHSDISTLDRVKILNDFRKGEFDVLVGVNLLREGIDLPEVAKVAIMDADKEGFLRNKRALIQMAGRAARHTKGSVVMYGTECTDSLQLAIEESNARCVRQVLYNVEHKIMPGSIKKQTVTKQPFGLDSAPQEDPIQSDIFYDIDGERKPTPFVADNETPYKTSQEELYRRIEEVDKEIEKAIQALDFKVAILLRDKRNRLLELAKGDIEG
jgi:excinuclease ABC subunit B